jgi:uncharacterized protein (DUF488 family)
MMHQPLPKQCFTIGYGNYPIDRFIDILRNVEIDLIIDVRSSPYSRFNPHFNRENLENSLVKKDNVNYRYMGDKIGGRYTDPGLLFPDGTVNYRKVQDTEKFQEGINEVLSIISSGKKIALMCAEKEPERCHRFALISPVLQSKEISVIHIRPDMELQANEDLERELIDSFFDTSQVSITGETVDFVGMMYETVNRGIGSKSKEQLKLYVEKVNGKY